MKRPTEAENEPATVGSALLPSALILVAGVSVLLLRGPVPVDETRYLQVLHESRDNLGFLTLMGRPYADKTPLLMWLAWLVSLLGPSLETSLRLMPALCSAGTVICAEGVGRRIGLHRCGWLQAVLLLPFVYSQFLLFDPLLTVFVWAAMLAWSGGDDRMAIVGAGLAFLAKGPVAALFLIPWAWALAPLRPRPEWRGPGLRMLGLGILPLALWALGVGIAGGPEFRRELWWDRWAGRIQDSFAHVRPAYYYIPVALLGALPLVPLLIAGARNYLRSRGEPSRPAWLAAPVRLAATSIAVFLMFSAMSGKQPHYLLPLAPVMAICAAATLRLAPRSIRWLRVGILAELSLFLIVIAWEIWGSGSALERYGDNAGYLKDHQGWIVLRPVGLALIVVGLVFIGFWRPRPVRSMAIAIVLTTTTIAPIHIAADWLTVPRRVGAALRQEDPATPIAIFGNRRHGLFHWLGDRSDIPKLGVKEARKFIRSNPGGILLTIGDNREDLDPEAVQVEVTDFASGTLVELLRIRGAAPPAEPEPTDSSSPN